MIKYNVLSFKKKVSLKIYNRDPALFDVLPLNLTMLYKVARRRKGLHISSFIVLRRSLYIFSRDAVTSICVEINFVRVERPNGPD